MATSALRGMTRNKAGRPKETVPQPVGWDEFGFPSVPRNRIEKPLDAQFVNPIIQVNVKTGQILANRTAEILGLRSR